MRSEHHRMWEILLIQHDSAVIIADHERRNTLSLQKRTSNFLNTMAKRIFSSPFTLTGIN